MSMLLVGMLDTPSGSSKAAGLEDLALSKESGVRVDNFLFSSWRVECRGSATAGTVSVVTTVAGEDDPSSSPLVVAFASSSSSML